MASRLRATSEKKAEDVDKLRVERPWILHDVCYTGDERKVLELIRPRMDVNAQDGDGKTPLEKALEGKREKIIIALIQSGVEYENANLVLHYAIRNEFLDLAKLLIRKGVGIDSIDYGSDTPLHKAAAKGYADLARQLFEKEADVNYPNSRGDTPLHVAVTNEQRYLAEWLVKAGADVNLQNNLGETPLHMAARNGNADLALFLLEKGAQVDRFSSYEQTPLLVAVFQKHLDVTRVLVRMGADINLSPPYYGKCPLDQANDQGSLDLVRLFKEERKVVNKPKSKGVTLKAKVNRTTSGSLSQLRRKAVRSGENSEGETPLHRAAFKGLTREVKLLIESGVDVNLKDTKYGVTPLSHAAEEGKLEVCQLLIERGANVHLDTIFKDKPLNLASFNGHVDIATLLVNSGSNINGVNDRWSTSLHGASSRGHIKVVEYLLVNGADTNALNKGGYAPLHTAAYGGFAQVVTRLLEAGANVNSGHATFKTALHLAIYLKHDDVALLLIENGSYVNAKDDGTATPLHLLADRKSPIGVDRYFDETLKPMLNVAELLLKRGANLKAKDKEGRTPLERAIAKGNIDLELMIRDKRKSQPVAERINVTKSPQPEKFSSEVPLSEKYFDTKILKFENERIADKKEIAQLQDNLSKLKATKASKFTRGEKTESVSLVESIDNVEVKLAIKELQMARDRDRVIIDQLRLQLLPSEDVTNAAGCTASQEVSFVENVIDSNQGGLPHVAAKPRKLHKRKPRRKRH